MMELQNQIKELAEANLQEIINVRRHLHAHPELSFKEFKTADFITSRLRKLDIPFEDGIAGTGIVAIIKGGLPSDKVVALRADMDALPINELNQTAYRSQNPGVMHACGHDVHTSCLLGAMQILNELKNHWAGTVKCIFQPGEEKLPGGASLMIKEGVLQDPAPANMFGQHVYPELEAGKVGFRSGMYMASTDEIYLKVKGKGGHAALPYQVIDSVLIASHLIVALQQVVSRAARPDTPSVLSFGKVIANGATNIIPDEVTIEGTFRTFNEEWRDMAHEKIRQIAAGLTQSMGGDCEVEINKGYPFLVNDELLTNRATENASRYLGKENIADLDLRMTAEDFAWFSQQVPSCFYRLGIRNESKGIISNLHTPTFDIDEQALLTGMGLMAWLAVCELK